MRSIFLDFMDQFVLSSGDNCELLQVSPGMQTDKTCNPAGVAVGALSVSRTAQLCFHLDYNQVDF